MNTVNLFDCPLEAAIPSITKQACNFSINQVQKFVFGRISGAVPFNAVDKLITAKATWDAAIAAVDEDKIVVTNYVNNVAAPATELIEDGGETNINRIPDMVDIGNALVTFNPRSITSAIRKELQALIPFSNIMPGVSDLGVMFINSDGDVIHDATDYWIPVYNFFVGDSDILGEKGRTNNSNGRFYMLGGWSNNLAKATPAFNIRATYPA